MLSLQTAAHATISRPAIAANIAANAARFAFPPPVTDSVDKLFSDPLRSPAPFRFDRSVVEVFPDMLRRSVPGYETVIAMTGLLAARFAAEGSNLYDLGCSLGASALAMQRRIEARDCTIVAVDNSPAMVEGCRRLLGAAAPAPRLDLRESDLRDVRVENASVVVLNYTLQFVPLEERAPLLKRIGAGLRPGGLLMLSEKVVFPNPALNRLNIDLHYDFKRAHGYSELEIAAKRDALDKVLIPETLQAHRERLRRAGFTSCDVWFQCFNFASLIALK